MINRFKIHSTLVFVHCKLNHPLQHQSLMQGSPQQLLLFLKGLLMFFFFLFRSLALKMHLRIKVVALLRCLVTWTLLVRYEVVL